MAYNPTFVQTVMNWAVHDSDRNNSKTINLGHHRPATYDGGETPSDGAPSGTVFVQ